VYLAAYGTLRTGQSNGVSPAVLARLQSRGPCLIPGRLYLVHDGPDAYPGLVPSANSTDRVVGELFEISESGAKAKEVLRQLDVYEDCHPSDAARSMYERCRIVVHPVAGSPVRAWVYLYTRTIEGMTLIGSGDWVDASSMGAKARPLDGEFQPGVGR